MLHLSLNKTKYYVVDGGEGWCIYVKDRILLELFCFFIKHYLLLKSGVYI